MKYQIEATNHSIERFSMRWRCSAFGDVIEKECEEALIAGRVSPKKPPGIAPPDDPLCIYAWTPDGKRVYALKVDKYDPTRFVVTTTMRAG